MDKLILQRLFSQDGLGIFGLLGGKWFTAELNWKNNQKDISCIPAGIYPCKCFPTTKHPDGVYHVIVSGRDAVEMHIGNFAGDTTQGYQSDVEGCIIMGKDISYLKNKIGRWQLGVESSTIAFGEFMNQMNGEDFELQIFDAPGMNTSVTT